MFCDFVPQDNNDRAWRYVDRPAVMEAPAIVDQPADPPAPARVPLARAPGLKPIFEEGAAVLDQAVESDDPDISDRLVIDDRDLLTDDEFSDDDTEFHSCRSTIGSN